jgi:hypothetical protein
MQVICRRDLDISVRRILSSGIPFYPKMMASGRRVSGVLEIASCVFSAWFCLFPNGVDDEGTTVSAGGTPAAGIVAWRRRAVRSFFCAISLISQILGYRSLTQALGRYST